MALFRRSASTPRSSPATALVEPATGRTHEAATRAIGEDYLARARGAQRGLLSSAFWSGRLMDWAMQDEAFKVQLFRFVDCYPMLRTPAAVHETLADYLSQPGVKPPPGMDLVTRAGGFFKGLMNWGIEGQITGMAQKFIAGTDAAGALPRLKEMWSDGMAFSVDLLGEACVSDEEAAAYQAKYLDLVTTLPAEVAKWRANPLLESNHLGPIPRTNVSIKISSLYARTDPIDTTGSIRGLLSSIRPILEAAAKHGVLVNFDMEQHALKDLTLELFMRACEEVPFVAGLAMQAYLRSGQSDAQRIIDWSKRTGRVVTVRLVKGAYWDYETIHAEQMGWPCPVWGRKHETDACFERMSHQFLEAMPRRAGEGGVVLALGSHNARSIASALAKLDALGLPRQALELQMLHGMADELKAASRDLGLRLREYVPVGELVPGMAYLVRRLLENTSNESWLRAGFLDKADPALLLADPAATGEPTSNADARLRVNPERHALSVAHPAVADGRPFFTEPFRDFSRHDQRDAFAAAVAHAQVPRVEINATAADADAAIASAHRAFPSWRDRSWHERSAMLVRAAAEMRSRRDALSALVLVEAGKPWREADGDTCEAIDFLEYYARQSSALFEPHRLGRFIGEVDEQWYQPRGVAVVISPWNFPLAICCGMVSAALACGNTVIVKPAEQTPAIAKELCEILWRAGVPREVLHFVAGDGETVGARLVRDARVALIAFTGSKAVGLDIVRAAGATSDDQENVKKVVCEMGGKNAIIIDASADLDEAVLGVRQSAFGFSGQKCSACSRAIVVSDHHDQFLHRLVESTRALVVGDPRLPGTDIGPVIDEEAARRIESLIDLGASEGALALRLPVPEGLAQRVGKPFVGPTILSGITAEHRLAHDEVFGPVVAVMRARDFDHALEIANSTRYKLTGGIFSRTPTHIARAKRDFRVGNLYINRGITGALVGRQPFGGFGMSGVGSKAGGADYLLQFVEPRVCCENAMRRGFAPGMME